MNIISQNPATPSSRDKANTFNNAEASMLRPAVDLTRSDTTVTPPIISVENETTEMEDSVIQDKHSYNTSTSHTTSVPIPVITIEEVQVGHWDEDEERLQYSTDGSKRILIASIRPGYSKIRKTTSCERVEPTRAVLSLRIFRSCLPVWP